MELTKEDYLSVIKDVQIKRAYDKSIIEKLTEISNMCSDLNLNQKGTFYFNIDTDNEKIVIKFQIFGGKTLDIFEQKGFDLLWDVPSWEIAKREIKDIFFDIRRNLKEKEDNKKISWWDNLKKIFTI